MEMMVRSALTRRTAPRVWESMLGRVDGVLDRSPGGAGETPGLANRKPLILE
jgi:hypothetical protein